MSNQSRPLRRLPGTFGQRLATVMDEHAAARAGGAMAHGALHLAHPDADEIARLRGLLGEVLAQFSQSANLGGPCLRTGWIPADVVERWRAALPPAKPWVPVLGEQVAGTLRLDGKTAVVGAYAGKLRDVARLRVGDRDGEHVYVTLASLRPADEAPLPARLGRFWCCPDHPSAQVRQFGAVACCMDPGCGYGPPPVSGPDGVA